MKKLLFIVFVAAAATSCNQPAVTKTDLPAFNLDSVKALINAANLGLSEALSANDTAKAASYYAQDACMFQQGMPKICGIPAISSFFGTTRRMGVGTVKPVSAAVTGNADLVAEEGTYEVMSVDGKVIDKGKYLVNWKPENGKWKILYDVAVSDTPMPPPAK